MTITPDVQNIARFRAQIVAMMGLDFDESKFSILATVLHNRMTAHNVDQAHYLDWLESGSADELQSLARDLTVTETYFLRNIDQFRAFSEVALPAIMSTHDGKRKIEILSAGCASGEEPYSIAIYLRERNPQWADNVTISGIDLNPVMLQKAARARYTNWSLRDLSEELKGRWFTAESDGYKLIDTIRKAVEFESRNLTQETSGFWIPGRFDIVFCRNVLMYFSVEQARAAIHRIARAIRPGGYLFLGHAETLRGLSNEFHLCQSNDTFYYQRKKQSDADNDSNDATYAPQQMTRHQVLRPGADTNWMEVIQLASERIHALNPESNTESQPVELAHDDPSPPDLERVLHNLHTDSYDYSLEQINTYLAQRGQHVPALLLKAVVLSLSGAFEAAEHVCSELLETDEFNAGAYYVMALCREGAGDRNGAAGHDKAAIYLDARFAMPWLHLGLIARRQNERDLARANLEQALRLLQQEQASRILLFGGGFRREALVALCGAELAALGEGK